MIFIVTRSISITTTAIEDAVFATFDKCEPKYSQIPFFSATLVPSILSRIWAFFAQNNSLWLTEMIN
jgi:hypothetical protein